jgi:hypothetical protein
MRLSLKQRNVPEADRKKDDPIVWVAKSSRKNTHAPPAETRNLVAPKKPRAQIDDADSIFDGAIAHVALRLHSKSSSTPSARGFEKELSKQQRLFLSEVSGDAPSHSSKVTPKSHKKKKIRINKLNWNKIEKLKQGRGSDDDSVPGLRADNQ